MSNHHSDPSPGDNPDDGLDDARTAAQDRLLRATLEARSKTPPVASILSAVDHAAGPSHAGAGASHAGRRFAAAALILLGIGVAVGVLVSRGDADAERSAAGQPAQPQDPQPPRDPQLPHDPQPPQQDAEGPFEASDSWGPTVKVRSAAELLALPAETRAVALPTDLLPALWDATNNCPRFAHLQSVTLDGQLTNPLQAIVQGRRPPFGDPMEIEQLLRLRSLRHVKLIKVKLVDDQLQQLTDLPNLVALDLHAVTTATANQFTLDQDWAGALVRRAQLRSLSMDQITLGAGSLAALGELATLQTLALSLPLGDRDELRNLAQLSGLRRLRLFACHGGVRSLHLQLTGRGAQDTDWLSPALEALAELPALQELELGGNQLRAEHFAKLPPSLRFVDLRQATLGEGCLDAVARLPELEGVGLDCIADAAVREGFAMAQQVPVTVTRATALLRARPWKRLALNLMAAEDAPSLLSAATSLEHLELQFAVGTGDTAAVVDPEVFDFARHAPIRHLMLHSLPREVPAALTASRTLESLGIAAPVWDTPQAQQLRDELGARVAIRSF